MRLIELAVVAGFVGLVAAAGRVVLAALRPAPAEWEVVHRVEDGRRRVELRRGSEVEPVGELSPDQPDYEDAFLALMARARERASVLNSER